MRTEIQPHSDRRSDALRHMLTRLRDETYERVAEFRREQRDSASATGDEMDIARSAAENETSASLIERAEERLRYIDAALSRLERGDYGICAECGEGIPLERLTVVPFAILCVDCQQNRSAPRHRRGGVETPAYDRSWSPSGDSEEVNVRKLGKDDGDDLPVMSAFEPDEPEGDQPPPTRATRGRPRKH